MFWVIWPMCWREQNVLFNIPSYHIKITHDGETIEDDFVFGMVTNSRSVGGFKGIIGKEVVFDDGEFEVTLIKTPKNPIELNEIVASLLIKQIDSKHMYSFKSGEVKFESIEEIPWTLDGEFGGEHDCVNIRNWKQGDADYGKIPDDPAVVCERKNREHTDSGRSRDGNGGNFRKNRKK